MSTIIRRNNETIEYYSYLKQMMANIQTKDSILICVHFYISAVPNKLYYSYMIYKLNICFRFNIVLCQRVKSR